MCTLLELFVYQSSYLSTLAGAVWKSMDCYGISLGLLHLDFAGFSDGFLLLFPVVLFSGNDLATLRADIMLARLERDIEIKKYMFVQPNLGLHGAIFNGFCFLHDRFILMTGYYMVCMFALQS